jgi:hypothetical protein
VTGRPHAQRIAEHLIRRACRRLPGDVRDERYREWAAELPAIVGDPDVRYAFLRTARMLRYAAGVARSTRRLPQAVGAPAWGERQPAIFPRPDGVVPAIAAVALWGTLLGLARAFPAVITSSGPWHPLVIAALFAPSALMALAVIRFVRWLRRRSRHTPGS